MENKLYRRNHAALRSAFLCGAATISLGAVVAPAFAQGPGLETVVVTGTSIRGAAPTGSNVIAVDREQIESSGALTMQQLTSTIPAITSFGTSAQSPTGLVGTEVEPTIHNFGASSSASTLILLNGRPMIPQGGSEIGDPSVIPSIALQRVDVMPDGDSAIYGSSAVAGVINFITRKGVEGLETVAQFGRAQNYNRADFGLIAGHGWDSGSVTFAYEYQSNSALFQNNRAFSVSADLRPQGLANFNTVNCSPADIAPTNAGTANIYLYPYTSAPIGTTTSINAANSAPCDSSGNLSFFPSRTTNTFYMDIQQDVGRVKIDFESGFNYRVNDTKSPAGSVTGTAFGPTGSSAAEGTLSRNPFYVGNAATGTSSEFIRYDMFPLLGYADQKSGAQDIYDNLSVTSDIAWGWEGEIDQTATWANDYSFTNNGFCSSCATLALNGTTNSGATANNSLLTTAQVDPFNLGNVAGVTRPLTTSNALDVWNPAATNRTSRTVLNELMGDQSQGTTRINMNDIKLKFDGPLFDLPAGTLKAAFGAEFNQINEAANSSGSNSTGSSQTGGSNNNLFLPQTVRSIFLEFAVPLVSPEMGIPLMQKLDLQVAGRIDGYSTTGWTHNPKLGLTWEVVDGLKARASYGTSFTAPNVNYVNGPNTVSTSGGNYTVPSSQLNYPGSFCTAQPGTCSVGGTFPGLTLGGPNKALKPMTGDNYSAGIDIHGSQLWAPLSGFTMSLTYWNTRFNNVITLVSNIGAGFLSTPGLEQYLQLAPPGGWTQTSPVVVAAISANRTTGPLPPTIYFIEDKIRVNGYSVDGDGIDLDAHYGLSTPDFGDFTWGYAVSAKLDWRTKGGPVQTPGDYVSYLNGRFNTSVIYAEAYEARMSLGWTLDAFSANFFWNYTNPYWFQTSTGPFAACTSTSQAACSTGYPTGFPTSLYSGGFQRVQANDTFDMDVSVKLPEDWLSDWTKGTKLGLNVRDILDSRPPKFNGGGSCNGATFCNGLDEFNGDPLERVITVSLRKTF